MNGPPPRRRHPRQFVRIEDFVFLLTLVNSAIRQIPKFPFCGPIRFAHAEQQETVERDPRPT